MVVASTHAFSVRAVGYSEKKKAGHGYGSSHKPTKTRPINGREFFSEDGHEQSTSNKCSGDGQMEIVQWVEECCVQ
jgi:hypothetical protein